MKKFFYSTIFASSIPFVYYVMHSFGNSEENLKKEDEIIEDFFTRKTILITGGSSGIGEGFALRLADYKTNLILCARTESNLQKVAEKCEKKGAKVIYITCDVTKEQDCKLVVEKGVEKFGGIDVLLLNAGISGSLAFSQIKDLSIFKKMIETNYMGYVNMTFHALPWIKKSNGRIGVVSSMSGKHGIPLRTAYCASKFAVNGFFEVLRNELTHENPEVKVSSRF